MPKESIALPSVTNEKTKVVKKEFVTFAARIIAILAIVFLALKICAEPEISKTRTSLLHQEINLI